MLFDLVSVRSIPKKDGFIKKAYVSSSECFSPSEIYINSISSSNPVHWRAHKKAHISIQVLSGSASISISSDPINSVISTINLDESSLWRIVIFPRSWFTFSSRSSSGLVLLCITDMLHDPSDIKLL